MPWWHIILIYRKDDRINFGGAYWIAIQIFSALFEIQSDGWVEKTHLVFSRNVSVRIFQMIIFCRKKF